MVQRSSEPAPAFPEFAELGLGHAAELCAVLAEVPERVSEFTFSNLYLFRHVHRYRVSRWRDFLLLTGEGYDRVPYALPPLGEGDPTPAARLLCKTLRGRGAPPQLFPVPIGWVERWFGGGSWVAGADRDQADYVYRRVDLAQLAGPKYRSRRNRLNKLLRELDGAYEYRELGEEHVSECLELAAGWCAIRCSPDRPSAALETEAVAG